MNIKLNGPAIKALERAAVRALEQTGEALHTEIVQARIVPRRDGNLQGEGFFVDYSKAQQGTVTLTHSTPYARRMYFHPEYNFHRTRWVDKSGRSHDGNPSAKGLWFEDYQKGGKKDSFALDTFKTFYKKEAGI